MEIRFLLILRPFVLEPSGFALFGHDVDANNVRHCLRSIIGVNVVWLYLGY